MTWLLGALVTLLAIGGLATPWWWSAFAQRRALRRRSANVAAYSTRLQEIEADVAAGVVAADTAQPLRDEIGARLLQDVDAPTEPELARESSRAVPALAALALLVFAGTWYAVAGSWRTQGLIELAKTDPEAAKQASVNQSIARLRKRVEAEPQEVESWVWLARSYRARGSHADAAAAFARANELRGHQDPDLLVEEGEAVAWSQDRSMAGVPSERFEQALALAPAHPQALWYAGIAALQRGDDAKAIARWEQLLAQPIEVDMRSMIEHSLAQLRTRSGIKAQAKTPVAAALQLRIEVDIAPELAAKVSASDSLFVFAQDPSGPPMPLAVQRLTAAKFPVQVTLDDTMSPMPTRKLSSLSRWRIVARVSRAGSAAPQPGDLEGSAELDKAGAVTRTRVVIAYRRD